jgi:hypothetical protein
MNWLFEVYSNVYYTAMGQRPIHRMPSGRAEQMQRLRRINGKVNL